MQKKEYGGINVIPSNTEKMISFSWRRFVFIDSLAFLNASLEKLSSSTPEEAFVQISKEYADPEQRRLIMRKGVYPYEYMDTFAKFDDTSLPPPDAFYSNLSGTVRKHLPVCVHVYVYMCMCTCVCVHV